MSQLYLRVFSEISNFLCKDKGTTSNVTSAKNCVIASPNTATAPMTTLSHLPAYFFTAAQLWSFNLAIYPDVPTGLGPSI